MAYRKMKDLSVKVGSYVQNGETKGRWETIGALMQGDDGNQFLTIKRTFNPAGVPVEPGKDGIIVSLFDPKPADGQRPQQQQRQAPAVRELPEDDIPFN